MTRARDVADRGVITTADLANVPSGAKNILINGNFDVWQRGTSFTITASTNIYSADRWRFLGAAFTGTLTRQSFTVGQTDVPNNPDYFARWDVTTNPAANMAFGQYIENVQTLAGKTATVSVYLKSNATIAANTLKIRYRQVTGGTGGTNNSVNIGEITTSWQKFTFTINIPSLSGATLGASNVSYLSCEILSDGSHTSAFQLDIAQWQLEEGDTATPFENRMYGTEFALCQRYHYVCKNVHGAANTLGVGFMYDATRGRLFVPFPVDMRNPPTIISTNISNSIEFNLNGNGARGDTATLPFAQASTNIGCMFQVSITTGSGSPGESRYVRYETSAAEIAFDAEL